MDGYWPIESLAGCSVYGWVWLSLPIKNGSVYLAVGVIDGWLVIVWWIWFAGIASCASLWYFGFLFFAWASATVQSCCHIKYWIYIMVWVKITFGNMLDLVKYSFTSEYLCTNLMVFEGVWYLPHYVRVKNEAIVDGIVKLLCMDRGFCLFLIHLLVLDCPWILVPWFQIVVVNVDLSKCCSKRSYSFAKYAANMILQLKVFECSIL